MLSQTRIIGRASQMAQHRNKACKAIESGIAGYPGGKNCLSARAAIRGKRATKNIRKCIFPEVLFGLLARSNRRRVAIPIYLYKSIAYIMENWLCSMGVA